tara:strand:- start:134 stop:748 length:615 start_codon:yes stop_codon:yes gene_type:complete
MEAADKSMVSEAMERTKGLGDTTASMPGTEAVNETVKEGMTLIERFYNGGNRARPGVADILVVVLDQVIGRMRNSMGMRVATIDACNAEIAQLDAAIGRIAPKQNELKAELEIKAARAAELRRDIKDGTDTLDDSVKIAQAALHKAQVATRKQVSKFNEEMKTLDRGYLGSGAPLPGREVNLRKNPNGPAARKPGDMLKDLKLS